MLRASRCIGLFRIGPSSQPQSWIGLEGTEDLPVGSSTRTVVSLQPVIEQDRDQNASERLDALWNKMFLDPVFFGTYPEIPEEELKPWIHEETLESYNSNLIFLGSTITP